MSCRRILAVCGIFASQAEHVNHAFVQMERIMKRIKLDLNNSLEKIVNDGCKLTTTQLDYNFNIDYGVILPNAIADELFKNLEDTVDYYDGDLAKVKVYGKWHQIPRQQVAYGDNGLKYNFSGNSIPAKPWNPLLLSIKDFIEKITGYEYNFVLINRYRNGADHIGEHRDNERDLDRNTPIASLSLGQDRLFVFTHRERRTNSNIAPYKLTLEHRSLLLMKPPTNEFWYHSLPARKRAKGVRINLTLRKINNIK